MFAHNHESFNHHYEMAAKKGALYVEETYSEQHGRRPRYAFLMNKVFPRSKLGYRRILLLLYVNFLIIAWGCFML